MKSGLHIVIDGIFHGWYITADLTEIRFGRLPLICVSSYPCFTQQTLKNAADNSVPEKPNRYNYWLDDRGIGDHFSCSPTRPGPIQPPFHWVPGALSSKVKQPGREAHHSPTSNAEMDHTSTPPLSLCAWHTVTTLTFYITVGAIFSLSVGVSSCTVTRRAVSPQQKFLKL
jgi:hypothetical protein